MGACAHLRLLKMKLVGVGVEGRTTRSLFFSQTPFWPIKWIPPGSPPAQARDARWTGTLSTMWWSISTERCKAEVVPPASPPRPPQPRVPSSTPGFLSVPSILAIPVETAHSCDLDAADAGTATLRAAGVTISGHPSGLSACSTENVRLCSQFDLCMWLTRHSQARLPSKRLPFPVCGV